MSSFSAKASPPAYGTAGIPPVQDVGQLVNNALAFQDDLNTLKNMLSHLDFAEQLTTQAESCQTKFYDLLSSSRDSASVLISKLKDFTTTVVPFVQAKDVSLEDKVLEVKAMVEEISAVAEQGPKQVETQFEDLKLSLAALDKMLRDYTKLMNVDMQGPLDKLLSQVSELEAKAEKVRADGGYLGRLSGLVNTKPDGAKPSAVGANPSAIDANPAEDPEDPSQPTTTNAEQAAFMKNSQAMATKIQAFFATEAAAAADAKKLEQKKRELATLKRDITRQKNKISKSQSGLTDLNKKFSVLDGKLGNFEGIWKKLIKDVKALDVYLSKLENTTDETKFTKLVSSESAVYKNIMEALDIYAIKTRRDQ